MNAPEAETPDAPPSTPPRRWLGVLACALVAPGLGHVRVRQEKRGAVALSSVWLLLLVLTAGTHRLLHRPGVVIALGVLLLAVWTAGVVDAVRLSRRAEVEPRPGYVCVGAGLACWLVVAKTVLPLVPTVPDLIEVHPTDQNAVSGAGGLTAGVSASGVLTALRWPGPAGRDHLDWRAVAGRSPGFGAEDSMGMFAGVVLDGTTHWLRDAEFETSQRYATDFDDAIVTEHISQALGLEVRETLRVHPERDLLLWRVQVTRLEGGPERARLVWFENLAPCTTKLRYLAISDWALDGDNDFAAARDARDALLVHFRPLAASPAPEPPADPGAWLDGLDADYGAGVYFALGLARPGSELGVSAKTAHPVVDADDGFAAGPAVGVLARELDLGQGSAEATLYLTASASLDGPAGARTLLREARERDAEAHAEEARASSAAWLERARLPATDDPNVLRLARRSLLALRNACDRPSGAIVASVAAQLPYALDWVRDGAFLNLALDEAGYPELVTRHNLYYARVQRAEGLFAGTFPMNTYEDGAPGGPIFLEIDNAALAVWTLADHARFLEGQPRDDYVEQVRPAVERGAEFLVRWRDPLTHLALPAHEDDNPVFRRGIQGTVSAILALRAAEDFGAATGAGEEALARWRARREELSAALFASFWDEDQGRLVDGGPKELDASSWALWPCAVFADDDPRAAAQGEHLWTELGRTLAGEKPRSGYDAKLFLALAALWGPKHPRRPQLVAAYREFAARLPTPDTGLLGEHCRITRDADGQVRFENLNNMPHVWEHALHYLTALRLFPR